MPYQSSFCSALDENECKNYALLVVDCSSFDRLGDIAGFVKNLPTAVIDHHSAGSPFGSVKYIDASSPATCVLVLCLSRALDVRLTQEEARLLFLGLCADTGFFRHVDADNATAFTTAATLVEAGASPKQTFAAINGGKTLASRLLLARVLARTESFFGGKLLYSFETKDDGTELGAVSRDSDMLYQLLLTIDSTEVVALLRQESEEKCTLGLRSREKIDVAQAALSLGGGGHKNAAGATLDGTIEELKPQIISLFKETLQ